MAIAEATGGTQSATLDTDHTLTTRTTAGVYVFGVDTSAMVAGDVTEITVYVKLRSASTSKLVYRETFKGPTAEAIQYSVAIPVPFEAVLKLMQTDGTGRSYEWTAYFQ
jgi:hypothetical protein